MLDITPEQCAAVYDMLRTMPPFNTAKLPESDAIEWRCTHRQDIHGEFVEYDPHIITISTAKTGPLSTLISTVAHEMVHLWQTIDNTRNKAQHNADWYCKARKVCKSLGLDPKAF
jgi:hypothetical protein